MVCHLFSATSPGLRYKVAVFFSFVGGWSSDDEFALAGFNRVSRRFGFVVSYF